MPTVLAGQAPVAPLLRDLASGFHQQMFFWGLDAGRSSGNLLVAQGFERRPSDGLRGTSCYRLPWRGGAVELHGSHAGFQTAGRGAYFIRPLQRCALWLAETPPVPGVRPPDLLDTRPSRDLLLALGPLLEWWLDYERRIAETLGTAWRERGYQRFRALPKSRPWLAPVAANQWVESLLRDPSATPRARTFRRRTVS